MSQLTGADALTSATDWHDYDIAAAAATPSSYPWYDAATGRARVYLNPLKTTEYRGPARGFQLLTAGSITIATASATLRTATCEAKEGYDVQFTEITAASSVVRVFW